MINGTHKTLRDSSQNIITYSYIYTQIISLNVIVSIVICEKCLKALLSIIIYDLRTFIPTHSFTIIKPHTPDSRQHLSDTT